jgi:hypothetical protein
MSGMLCGLNVYDCCPPLLPREALGMEAKRVCSCIRLEIAADQSSEAIKATAAAYSVSIWEMLIPRF